MSNYKQNNFKKSIIAASAYFKEDLDNPLNLWYGYVITSYVKQGILVVIPGLILVNRCEHSWLK